MVSEMTREHLEAVRIAIGMCQPYMDCAPNGRVYDVVETRIARLSEVAAMIEAKLEEGL